MHGSIRNKISKEILLTIPEQEKELDKQTVLKTLDEHWQGLTVFQLAQALKVGIPLVVRPLMALNNDGLVVRQPNGIWCKKE